MKRAGFFFFALCCSIANVYGLPYSKDQYMVYEIAPTANTPGSFYIAPRINFAVASDLSQVTMSSQPTLSTNTTAYHFSLSADGHLSAPSSLANFTGYNATKLGAAPSRYRLFDGHLLGSSAHTFLLQGDGNRDSVLFDLDSNGTPYIYYNFGSQLDQSTSTNIVFTDVDSNGFDDIVSLAKNSVTRVALYNSGSNSFIAANGLQANQVGLLINDNDPYSVAVGEYYRVKRGIPNANIVHLQIPTTSSLDRTQFAAIKSTVDAALPATVEVLSVAWTSPFRVECNSITSALARGFDAAPCDEVYIPPMSAYCALSTASPYYNSPSARPFTDLKIRPAMLLAARSWDRDPTKAVDAAKALIDRGIASDGAKPQGAAYIINNPQDSTRSLRATSYPASLLGYALSPKVNIQIINADSISNKNDTLFYFEGNATVPNLATNNFPNGAIADTLTSVGGVLDDTGGQINILDFISAGATGTFGTVTEPCAHSEKFPNPSIVVSRYINGETLIEAYWKSISQTFQGLFIGEPLAHPWR